MRFARFAFEIVAAIVLSGCLNPMGPDDEAGDEAEGEIAFEFEPGFYVSVAGTDKGSGTQDDPFLTIEEGIDAAALSAADSQNVYVAAGTYSERIFLENGVTLYGGFHPTSWKRDIDANASTIVIDESRTVHIEGSGDVLFEDNLIVGSDYPDTDRL